MCPGFLVESVHLIRHASRQPRRPHAPLLSPSEFRKRVLDLVESGLPRRRGRRESRCHLDDDLQLVEPASDRHRPQARDLVDGQHRADRSPEADSPARGRARRDETSERAAQSRWCPRKEIRSGRGDGRRGPSCQGFLQSMRRVELRVLHVAQRPPRHHGPFRHAWLTRPNHRNARHVAWHHGARRVYAAPPIGQAVSVGIEAISMLMRRAGYRDRLATGTAAQGASDADRTLTSSTWYLARPDPD